MTAKQMEVLWLMSPLIRVGVWALPNMLNSILVEDLSRQPGLSVRSVRADQCSLAEFVSQRQLDVLIVGSWNKTHRKTIEEVLQANPKLMILAVEDDGRETFLWQMVPDSRPLGQVSLIDIAATIRAVRERAKN
jgi:hypothetical protein